MAAWLVYFAKVLLLPPGVNFVIIGAGWLLRRRARRLSGVVAAFGVLALLLLCIPAFSGLLAEPLERVPVITAEQLRGVDAIVVLAGGREWNEPEYGGDIVSDTTLRRIRYAARLVRASGLPLLVTGGTVLDHERPAEAALMAESLRADFGIEPKWIERTSRNTAENARNSAALLKADGVASIALVSDAMHLRRAGIAFRSTGLAVVPAPTAYFTDFDDAGAVSDWLPSVEGLAVARYALHEHLGRLYYRLRYGMTE